jgi:alcohol dehydrogenase
MIGFRMPTRVHIAPGCLSRLPEAVRSLGMESVLLVVDPGLLSTEWPRTARRALTGIDVRCQVFDAVEPNPRTSTATAAAEVLRAEALRGVVALGGGSVLDAAKAAAMLATNDIPIEHLEGKNRFSRRPLPMVAVPTTCGTGSEVTWVSVLTHEPTRTKISVKGETMFPDQALVDADLIRTLPPSMVAATGFDALTHAVEATTGRAANPVADALAEKAIALLFRYLARAAEDVAGDDEAREAVMRASTVAGMAFGNADVGGVHCLSETLGGLYDVPHGVTNAILLEPVLRHHRPVIDERLADLDLMLCPPGGEGSADHFFEALAGLRRRLGIPAFASLNVPRDGYEEVAAIAVRNNSNGSNPQPMGARDYLKILESLD